MIASIFFIASFPRLPVVRNAKPFTACRPLFAEPVPSGRCLTSHEKTGFVLILASAQAQ
jgi:hypothetical protein